MSYTIHETPFGRVAIRVNADGSLYIQPAHGLDERGHPARGFLNTDGGATLTVNGKAYALEDFSIIANTNYGQYHAQYPENDNRDPREWVADFSAYSGYTAAARAKLGAWFLENRAMFATPQAIAAARVSAAESRHASAERAHVEACQAARATDQALTLAAAELEAARENVAFGNSVAWIEPSK